MFTRQRVPHPPFSDLVDSVRFEHVTQGRQGTVLVRDGGAVVRTTTVYQSPAQLFKPIHDQLADPLHNNILAEVYDNTYFRMGWHSDQAQDLAPGSTIAVFSAYENPNGPKRILKVKSKTDPTDRFEIVMEDGMVIEWTTDTNDRYLHKIVLEPDNRNVPNRWFGMTMRTSVRPTITRLATEAERIEYLRLRAKENHDVGFEYPSLEYTISPSDLSE